MIDRSYLPYPSARAYVDRGMAKWMGFFISEHATALAQAGDSLDFSGGLSLEEKLLYLSQLLLNRQRVLLYTSRRRAPFLGTVHQLTQEKLYFKTADGLPNFAHGEILRLTLPEGVESE
ncbi:MAG: hypothetical protein Q4E76_05505 [Tissierellia bacterium]|nr:hypothetical protein [Tissierellia bacterium]